MVARRALATCTSRPDCRRSSASTAPSRRASTTSLTPETDTRRLAYSILTDEQKKRFENDQRARLLVRRPGPRPLPRQRLPAARRRRPWRSARSRTRSMTFEQLGLPPVGARVHQPHARAWSWSPARPAAASRRRWRRCSTRINHDARSATSSRSRTRSSTSTSTRSASSTSARSTPTPSSFPTALKYVLRQDPDVILIGEMRDLETIAAALTIAETGHLVFATLHTNSHLRGDQPHRRRVPARTSRTRSARSSRSARGRDHAAADPARHGRGPRPVRGGPGLHAGHQGRRSATTRSTRSTASCRPARSTACRR